MMIGKRVAPMTRADAASPEFAAQDCSPAELEEEFGIELAREMVISHPLDLGTHHPFSNLEQKNDIG